MNKPFPDFQLMEWVVRPQRLCLERDSEVIHLKPKSMAVLECLAKAKGAVVSRKELFQQVWPGAVVSDDVLTQSVVELRRAFGDAARSSQIIETIPKRGFRLLPPIDELAGASSNEISPALVVLPFADMSPDGDQQYLADGMAEEIRNVLARLKGLQVIGRTSGFSFRDKNPVLAEIAAALDVEYVLEGSVRHYSDQMRVTAQLVNAANGIVLWAEKFDRELQDIFAVQDEIARAVATALSIKLGVGNIAGLAGSTDNVEAYNELLRGQNHYREYTTDSLLSAIDHFRIAIELDPQYAKAWERLADVYCTARFVLTPDQLGGDWQDLSGVALDHAQLLAPDSPELLTTVAFRQTHLEQWAEAARTHDLRANLLRANAIDANFTGSTLLLLTGQLSKAVHVLERERRLDPRSAIVSFYLSSSYTLVGKLKDALEELEHGYQLRNYRLLIVWRAWITALLSGERALLQLWLERAWEVLPERTSFDTVMLELIDDSPRALQWLREFSGGSAAEQGAIIIWAAFHGDTQLALRELIAKNEVVWDYWNPLLADCRQTDEFKQLVMARGLVDYWREFGWGDFCQPLGETDFECY